MCFLQHGVIFSCIIEYIFTEIFTFSPYYYINNAAILFASVERYT